ncbi:zinc transporter ZntB [uncultured Sunxiuqinia sp.]|uniref:zinc transporter ZntB n=1 Tax=uncultured Sunxiuqinia sp. TaxID=1573825 RepID=UPI00262F9F1D|nr:zinc transporter ZntB [uncultured Sunxiuqinia sp.]
MALLHGFNIFPAAKKLEHVSENQLDQPVPEQTYQWLQFDLNSPNTPQILRSLKGIDELFIDALLKEETRPRISVSGDDLLVILRGVNLAEGADPEDMVAIRMVITRNRIISCQRRSMISVNDVIQQVEAGNPPKSTGHFLVFLCERLIFRMSDVMEDIEDRSAEIEELVLDDEEHDYHNEIHNVRRQIIQLKRFLVPQREALLRLQLEKTSWLTVKQQHRFREITDQLIRFLEMLDAAREMGTVSQETLYNRQNEQMNKRMYVLSIVAAFFLPLGFFTGLLGVNLAGIPKAESPVAFLGFIVILLVVVGFQFWLFKRNKWL